MKKIMGINMQHLVGGMLAFATIIFWASNSIVSVFIAGKITPLQTSLFRWLFAGIVLLPFAAKSIVQHKEALKRHKGLLLSSSLLLTMDHIMYYGAGALTSATNLGIFLATMPLFLLVFEFIFLRDKLSLMQIIGCFVGFISVLYAVVQGNFQTLLKLSFNKGDIMALLSVLCLSAYTFLQTKRTQSISQVAFLTVIAFLNALINLPLVAYQEYLHPTLASLTLKEYGILLYLGIFVSALSYWSWGIAVQKIGPLKTGFFNYFSMPVTALLSMLLLSETITTAQIISSFGIITGCILVNLKKKHHTQTMDTAFSENH